jgi:putative pyruvate formate lyase activating enzyme
MPAAPRVGSAGPHFGEEDVLVGRGGSGTIFLSSCNLGCRFCQNWSLSHLAEGEAVSVEKLARFMLALEARSCENVNLVTPTHFAHACARAIRLARGEGLRVPLVWNCGGYESAEALKCLDGLVEIYMPDLKTLDAGLAAEALGARDYPERAREALRQMHRQVGDLATDARGLATRGLLVRHLVMPGRAADARACLEFLAELSPDTFVNVMGQYRPCGEADQIPGLGMRPARAEIAAAKAHARALGLRLAEG